MVCQREDRVLCPGWVLGIPKEGIREMIRESNVSGSPGDPGNETLTLHIVSLALQLKMYNSLMSTQAL